jgi:CubicO group peptidase (beta-lactamase class C family)
MRLTFLLTAVAVFAIETTAEAQKPKKPADSKSPGTIVEGEAGRKLDEHLERVDKSDGGFCGNALVSVGGKVLLEKGYGVADASNKQAMPVDALWDWASVSKQFTAAAILRLQDKKKLKLDDPVKAFYPDARKEQAGVTLRQLLTHTSGIEAGFKNEWKFDGFDRESFEKLHTNLPLTSKPGEKFEYNNAGYAFLAAIVEKVSGKTFEEFCAEELFKPAGMKSATMIGTPQLDLARVPKINRGAGFPDAPQDRSFAYGNKLSWGYRGCGGFVMSARDMHLWDRALRGDKVLSKAAKEDLYRPALDNYALGWEVVKGSDGRVASHSGGVRGVVAYVTRGIDEDFIVALVCSYEPKTHPATLARELLAIAKGK